MSPPSLATKEPERGTGGEVFGIILSTMSRPRRIALLIAGLALVTLACFALVYAFMPLPSETDSARPAPTLFAPP